MTEKTQPTDAELFALIKEHFGLDQRRDDTVINRSTGRFHDAQRYRDFAAAVLAIAKWGQPAQAADSVQEDAARLDWLLLRISGAEFRRLGVHYSGNARRADVDAAIAAQQGGV